MCVCVLLCLAVFGCVWLWVTGSPAFISLGTYVSHVRITRIQQDEPAMKPIKNSTFIALYTYFLSQCRHENVEQKSHIPFLSSFTIFLFHCTCNATKLVEAHREQIQHKPNK